MAKEIEPVAGEADHSRRAEMPPNDDTFRCSECGGELCNGYRVLCSRCDIDERVTRYYDSGGAEGDDEQQEAGTDESQTPSPSKGADEVREVSGTVARSATSERSQDSRQVVVARLETEYFVDGIGCTPEEFTAAGGETAAGLRAENDRLRCLLEAAEDAERQWKANHADVVRRKRVKDDIIKETRAKLKQASPEPRPAPPPLEK